MYQLTEQKCPYCNNSFLSKVDKTGNCKNCGNTFKVVINPLDTEKKKIISTQKEYEKLKEEKHKKVVLLKLRNFLMSSLVDDKNDIIETRTMEKNSIKNNSGINLSTSLNIVSYNTGPAEKKLNILYEKTAEKLEKQFNIKPSERDILWGIADALIVEKNKVNDLQGLSSLYFNMALCAYGLDEPYYQMKKESLKMGLMNEKNNWNIKQVKISSGDDCCELCKKNDGRVLTIDEALKEMPIPAKECTTGVRVNSSHGWCVCYYEPII